MSIDALHERIRKLKNPVIVDFFLNPDDLPQKLTAEAESLPAAYGRFCRDLMTGLKGVVPGVRFSFSAFALWGGEGLDLLSGLLSEAAKLGFYIILDTPDAASPILASQTAVALLGENSRFHADGLVVSPYIGSDAIKPFLPYCKNELKDLFLIVRSPNKSASELQDLMTGTRLVHGAAADLVGRYGETVFGKCGYSRVCALISAGAPESIRNLRGKYKYMFFLVDGLDYPSGNAKNCSFAFDRFGYGAAVSVGSSVTAAWKDGETEAADHVEAAVQSVERIRKNIARYVTIL